MKQLLLLVMTLFIYHCVYNFTDKQGTDRDNALIIASERFMNGLNPYDTLTAINNPLTTGISSILYASIINERHLSFLFWIWITAIFYSGKHFILYSIFMLIGFIFFARTIIYRLEELYFGIIPLYYAYKYNFRNTD